jgi:subtilisin family serine protease
VTEDITPNPGDQVYVAILSGTPENLYTDTIEAADEAFPQINVLGSMIKDIYRANRGHEADPSVQTQIGPLVNRMSLLRKQRARFVTDTLAAVLGPVQEEAIAAIEANRATRVVSRDVVLNSVTILAQPDDLARIRAIPDVLQIAENAPVVPVAETTAQALKLRPGTYPDVVWDKGFHGEGGSVLAIDTGVDTTHPAFTGLDLVAEKFPTYAGDCTPSDQANHGTHTAGVIASRDPVNKGMAWGIDHYYSAKLCDSYDGFASFKEAYEWAALGGSGFNEAQVINFSMVFVYQCDDRSGTDIISDYVDNTVDLYDVIWSLGAGNRSAGCENDRIDDKPAVCYNGLAVAAMSDSDTGLRDDDQYYTDSKYGPCTGPDGTGERLKPDIVVPTLAMSPSAGGGFGAFPGTSGSAPHFSGYAAALFSAGVQSSLELRALAFATAEDYSDATVQEGVDYYTGFGYADAWEAYAHIGDTFSGQFSSDGQTKQYEIKNVHAGDKVVLVYNKHLSGSLSKLSNLDIKVYDKSGGTLLHETTKDYENKEYIEFGPSDEGKDVVVEIVATKIASGVTSEHWAVSANTVMGEVVPADSKAPTLLSPLDLYNFSLGTNLVFKWKPATGTSPTAYWLDLWVDGGHYQLIPEGGMNLGMATQLSIPSQLVETRARDGVWEWAVAATVSSVKHWSPRNIMYKTTAPMLQLPTYGATVNPLEKFDWTDTSGAINYVAKIGGIKPAGEPLYLPLNSSTSELILKQGMYDILQTGNTYSWAIAATALGANLPISDQNTLSKLSYSVSWTFTK